MTETIVTALATILAAFGGIWVGNIFSYRTYLRIHTNERLEHEQDRARERQSFRTLLSLELLQNATAVLILRSALESALAYDDAQHITLSFLVTAVPPNWEKARWNSLETGRYLTASELMRIGEWYTKLDGATFLYERLMEQLRHLPLSEGKLVINPEAGNNAVQQVRGLLDYIRDLQANPPPLPDAKLNSGESVQEYLDDLKHREPDAFARQPPPRQRNDE